ncbi:MAG: flagellar hook-basal body complex protein [Terricaulis sp.]
MFGAMFVGLSGMNTYSKGLRQISNNITNLNSQGFKATKLLFSDVFSAGAGGAGRGQGVTLAEGRLDFSQGELRQSDQDLDLAIEGDGFLVLLKDGDQYFTRTGSFEINEAGDLVLAGTDYRLTVLDANGAASAISVNAYRTNPAQATTRVKFSDNLSSSATELSLSNIRVFNEQGASDAWNVRFERTETSPAGEWTVIVRNSQGAEIGRQTLRFTGSIVDPTTSSLVFSESATGRSATFDFSAQVTSFSSGQVSTLRVAEADGRAAGEIRTVRVNDAGVLEVSYTNEQTTAIGAVALARFQNPQNLEQRSGGLFVSEGARPEFLSSANEAVGRVIGRRLEAGNVDLAKEFGELILVQRGFQASSQVVSVSNDMIQQLFGIRGQG